MERKRKLPPRAAARSEVQSKKRTSTPPEPAAPAAPVEESLPNRIIAGKPLPTVERPQPEDLPSSHYQTYSESGVIGESLERSRKKWLSEGIFEKYWSKPSKRRNNAVEQPGNPPRESMTKIGTCTITIEPHVFEAVMFSVKDSAPRLPQPPPQPLYRPIIQYGPPQNMTPQSAHVAPTTQPLPSQSSIQAGVKSQDSATKTPNLPNKAGDASSPSGGNASQQSGGQGNATQSSPVVNAPDQSPPLTQSSAQPSTRPSAQPSTRPSAQPSTQPATQPATQPVIQATIQPLSQHPNQNRTGSAPPSAPPAKSSDPVIQMLAERAATDQELKSLMRIVADGKASTEELRRFQGHIDELTKLLQARQASKPASPVVNPQTNTAATAPNNPPPPQPPAPAFRPAQNLPTPNGLKDNQAQPQVQALRSKGPLPPSKPDISAVVFEFVGGSGDRFLFPKYSILEYLPGGQVIASFLIVRKGSSAESKGYDPTLDYYQPVTIRLYTHQGKQLETLAKVVAHPDEVRKYMDDVMTSCMRAEYVLLAMRLPREAEHPAAEEEDSTAHDARDDNRVLWTASANGTATKPKLAKKPLTEGEQFQSFIASVS